MTYRVVLAGASGYGRSYLRELAELQASDAVRLVGICDIAPLDAEGRELAGNCPEVADLERLLRDARPDVGIVATPIHTHARLAGQVIESGAALLLEKPPTATLQDWRDLVKLAGERPCQVGFQSLGSAAFQHLATLMRDGTLGEIRGIGGWGAWSRTDAYYRRAGWAGRRELDGAPVVDGALTNPFAHAAAGALALDASTGEDDIVSIEAELLRTRDMEADDTSCVRLRTARGTTIVVAVTLCAAIETEPVLTVHGSRGRAELHYTRDVLIVDGETRSFERTTPLANLLAHLEDEALPLQAPLGGCGAFMRLVEAVRLAQPPAPIDPRWLRWSGTGERRRVDVLGVEAAVREAAETLRTFSELDLPWAAR